MKEAVFIRATILAALLMLFIISGCGRVDRTAKHRVVLVTKALDSEWWMTVKRGAEVGAREHPDVDLAVLAPEREVNIDQQVSIIEDQIFKKVSALVVAPTGAYEVIPVLIKAKKENADEFLK